MTDPAAHICEHLKASGQMCMNRAKFYRHCEEGIMEHLCGTHANYEARYGAIILEFVHERQSS